MEENEVRKLKAELREQQEARRQAEKQAAELQQQVAKLQAEKELSDGFVQNILNYTGTRSSASSRCTDYRGIAQRYYFPRRNPVMCMVSGIQDDKEEVMQWRVICGHILASSQIEKEQKKFDFEGEEDLHSNPRNLVFWLMAVEKAWTNNAVAFEWSEEAGTFYTWVLDTSYMHQTFVPDRYFHELHGTPWAYKFRSNRLSNCDPEPPFRRLMHTIFMAGCINARQRRVLPDDVKADLDKLSFSGAKVKEWLSTVVETGDVVGDDTDLEQQPLAGAGL